jgi:hypothetical protein
MRSARSARLVWIGAALVACSAPPSASEETTGVAGEPIVHGTASTSDQDYVVLIYDSKAGFECTGTIIGPSLVLTARHCVTSLTSGDALECDGSGNPVSGGQLGADYAASDLAVYVGASRTRPFPTPNARGTKIVHDGSPNLCAHDLAVLEIAPPITTVAPAKLRLDAAPSTQDTVTVVGWGVTDTQQISSLRTQRNGIAVLSVGSASYQGFPVPPNDFLIGESICDGDSGAPAIAELTGAVVGLASYGTNGSPSSANNPLAGCVDNGMGVLNTFTSLAPFKSVVQQAFADTGGQPSIDDTAPAPKTSASKGCGCDAVGRANGSALAAALLAIVALARRALRRSHSP